MFQRFDEDTKKVLKRAKIEMQELKHPFVGTEHLLLSILKLNDLKITNKLKELILKKLHELSIILYWFV